MLFFNNHYKSERVPFIIYADTESLIKSIQTCEPCSQSSYTKKYQKHEPISFLYFIKCFDDNVFKPVLRTYTGEDAMQKSVEWLEEDITEIANIPEVDMIFGKEEAARFNKETKCWICEKELNDDKVRDHCHFTGRYRGAAHNSVILTTINLILHLWCFIILVVMIVIYLLKTLVLLLVILIVYRITRKNILVLLKI